MDNSPSRDDGPLQKLLKGRITLGGRGDKVGKCVRTNLLTILVVTGLIAGTGLGFILRGSKDTWNQRERSYVKFPGEIFLRMLKVIILPLIFSSLVSAIGSLDLKLSGKIGARAIVYYGLTTIIAVVIGIILVTAIHPGKTESVTEFGKNKPGLNVTTPDTLMDLVRNMFPPNVVHATIAQYQTVLVVPSDPGLPLSEWSMSSKYVEGTNFMGLVVFATVFGITLAKMGEKGKALLEFFKVLSETMMIITNWIVWLSPLGICFLIAAQLLEADDIGGILSKLGLYFGTVLLGLFVHGLIVLPILYTAATRKLPFRFIGNMTQALATAFGTASSSATLPITIGCLEDKNGVDPRVSRFVLPIGATINMDGTALYEAVAAIFISQMHQVPLTLGSLIAISITATAASVGAAGIPQAGLVTMVMVLNTLGLPAEYVSYIVPVDWLLDRFRTTINVLGDSLGAGIVDHLSKKELRGLSELELQGINEEEENKKDEEM